MIRISTAAALSLVALFGAALVGACNGNDDDLPGGACSTCADIYTNGGIVCGPSASSDAWRTLSLCACGTGICNPSCVASFCQTMPADETCGSCLETSCAAQVAACGQN